MERKLVQQGNSTLMTSLPKEWVDSNGLVKGDTVDIVETPAGLLVEAKGSSMRRKLSFNVETKRRSAIKTFVTNSYRAGFDVVNISYEEYSTYETISNTVTDVLLGFEITEKSPSECSIESLTEPSRKKFELLFNKIFHNIGILFDELRSRFSQDDGETEIEDIQRRIYQYKNFCKRVINKHRVLRDTSEFYNVFLTTITHAQRELYHAAQDYEAPSEDVIGLINGCEQIFRIVQGAWKNESTANLHKTHEKERQVIHGYAYGLLEEDVNKASVARIIDATRRFHQANSSLSGIIFLS